MEQHLDKQITVHNQLCAGSIVVLPGNAPK